MNGRAGRNVPHRQCVPNQNVGVRTAHNLLPDLQPVRLDDITLLAVRVAQQRYARRAAGIIFNRHHRRRYAVLVALEIDGAQQALVPAAPEPHGGVAGVAPSARPQLTLDQRLMGLLRRNVIRRDAGAVEQRLRSRSVSFDGHISSLCKDEACLVSPCQPEAASRVSTTDSARTPASSRPTGAAHMPSSNPDDSRQTSPAAALSPDNLRCAPKPPSL